jgi:hypothetical protein
LSRIRHNEFAAAAHRLIDWKMDPFLLVDASAGARRHTQCRMVKWLVLRVNGDRAGERIDTSTTFIAKLVWKFCSFSLN